LILDAGFQMLDRILYHIGSALPLGKGKGWAYSYFKLSTGLAVAAPPKSSPKGRTFTLKTI